MPTTFQPPHLWPSPQQLKGGELDLDPVSHLEALLERGDTVQGVLVDLTARGVARLGAALGKKKVFRGSLVVTLSPACPTRKNDLRQLLNLRDEFQGDKFSLQLRLLPLPSGVTPEARHSVAPPSLLLVQDSQSGRGWLWHGTNGDLDLHAPYHTGSFNLILPASPAVMGLWHRQFDYVAAKAAPLKETSTTIPHLVPAPGEIEAARQWVRLLHHALRSRRS